MSREPAAIVALRQVYRRFAGPKASLTHVPRAILRRIFGPDFTIRIEGKPFTVNLSDEVVSATLLAYRKYEVLETALMKSLVKPGFHALDIGANIGFFSVLLGDLVGPEGRVAAFEPEPNNARLLAKNVRDRNLTSVVTVVQAAVGEAAGSAMLFLDTNNMGDHRLYRVDESGSSPTQRQSVDVAVVRVDDVVASWPRVDFIKMDIQGFELHAIRGMSATLSRNPGVVMLTEFWPFGLRATGSDPVDYLNALRDLGFKLWDVSEQTGALEPLDQAGDRRFVERLEPDLKYVNLLCARSANAFDGISPLLPARSVKSSR
jgi:FkbM family methyltransferase